MRDFADPDVVRVGDGCLAYCTNSVYGGRLWHVPMQRADAITGPWTEVGDAMPTLPGWVDPLQPWIWAPEMATLDDGRSVLYFTARHGALRVQRIGVAVADSPKGPFTAVGGPLICRPEDGDTLDAEAFQDRDGSRYLFYKSGPYPHPGHEDVVSGPGGDFLVFHASINQTERGMFVVGLGWTADGRPEVRPVPQADDFGRLA